MISDFLSSNLSGYEAEFLTKEDLAYLNKFWLPFDQIREAWGQLLSEAFDCGSENVRIRLGRSVDIRVGGCLFEEDDFSEFSERGIALGAKSFAVIEDGRRSRNAFESRSSFRFAFPIAISWRELAHAAPISEDVFQRPIRCFFVISDNGKIGKYVDNDADRPFQIIFEDHSH